MNTSSSLSARFARGLVPAIPFLWLGALFLTPFLIVLKISLSQYAVAQPPYTPHFDWNDIPDFLSALSVDNYETLLGVPLTSFLPVFLKLILTMLAGIPLAFVFAAGRRGTRSGLTTALLLPFIFYGLAKLLAKVGAPSLYDWLQPMLFAGPDENGLSPLADWLLSVYLYLPFVVFPIAWWSGNLYPRHYASANGVFSLQLAANTVWRKAKAGLLVAVLAGFAAATAHMMQREFNGDSIYWEALLSSLRIACISTVLLLLVGFPISYAMARAPKGWRPILVAAVMLPFWTSFLIRIYSWKLILEPFGVLNSETAVFIGIVYGYLPFMILPLYATLEKMDLRLIEAATDLGSPPWRTFWTITVPLAKPGIFAGSLLCFIPVVGELVIPELLGGSDTLMIGKTLWSEFFSNRDWPLASAVAIVFLIILVIPIVLYQRVEKIELDIDHPEAKP